MRNTILIGVGKTLKSTVLRLQQYLLQHGEPDVNDYIQVLGWCPAPEASGAVEAVFAERMECDTNEFHSDLSEDFSATFGTTKTLKTDQEIAQWWKELFGKTVTLEHCGDSEVMHLLLIAPLWEKETMQEVQRLASIVKGIPLGNYGVDLMAIPPSMAFLFDTDLADTASNEKQREQESVAHARALMQSTDINHTVMFERCNTSGISLMMDYDTWLRILGEYALIATENYDSLFPVTMLGETNVCTTFGLSILEFDHYYFVHYLLRRAYLKLLSREQVQQKEVDINKVSVIAREILSRHLHKFTEIYQGEVCEMIRQGQSEDNIIGKVSAEVKTETSQMLADFQGIIDREDLSLPEKQATIAMLLGLNDELLSGYLYERNPIYYDDCGSDAFQVFIDENNLLKEPLLDAPRRESTKQVFLPVQEIHASRQRITESDRYIRKKSEEIAGWEQQIKESDDSNVIHTEGGKKFEYRLMDDEEVRLFEENYEPHETSIKSLDMRQLFTDVRNQGQLGSCTVFAVTSVYEFLLKKLSKPKTDLSEYFVYYNVLRDENGVARESGTSINEVVESIARTGICIEELCRYDDGSDLIEKPSPAAYEEAKNHLIKKAKNVVIGEDRNANHKAITSALADGYPVIISLNLYESFDQGVKGFIQHPAAGEARPQKHGSHAMVICGFSEEEHIYIVRNSWGRNWGDNGYCYLPFSYVDDHEYCNQASIITQIAESDDVQGWYGKQMPSVSFSTTDALIRRAIATLLVEEERLKMQAEERNYRSLAQAYMLLTSELENNSLRRQILDGAEMRLNEALEEKKKEKTEFIQNTYEMRLNAHRRHTRDRHIQFGIVYLIELAIAGTCLYSDWIRRHTDSDFWITLCVIIGITVIAHIIYAVMRRSSYNNLERELDAIRDRLAHEYREIQKELESKRLKLHIAGMFVDTVNKVQRQIDHGYKMMRSYVGNLDQWMTDETEKSQQMTMKEKIPFIPVLKNEVLDVFFEAHQEKLLRDIHLYQFLDQTDLSEEKIVAYKRMIRDHVAQALQTEFADFSMADYVLGNAEYQYLSKSDKDLKPLLSKLDRHSDCFLQQLQTDTFDQQSHSRYVMISTRNDHQRGLWNTEYPKYFSQAPSDVTSFTSRLKLIELQVKRLKPEEIGWMYVAGMESV